MIRIGTAWICILTFALAGELLGDDGAQLLENRVDTVLREWAAKTGEIRSLYSEFTRTIVDPVWNDKDVSPGMARYMSPKMARLDVTGGRTPETLILPGTGEAWHYKPATAQGQDSIVEIHELPKDVHETDVLEDGPLPFLFATKPEKAKQRYKFEILEETETLLRARIIPKLEDDQREFVQAEISLDKKDWLPTKIVILESTKQEVTYELKKTWTNIDIPADHFAAFIPKGWKSIRMQAAAPVQDGRAVPPAADSVPPVRVGRRE